MEKDHELGWEVEMAPRRDRGALPGERAARFCSFGITEALTPLIISGLTDIGGALGALGGTAAAAAPGAAGGLAAAAGLETASIPLTIAGIPVAAAAAPIAAGLVGAGKGALTSAITGGNIGQGAAIGGLGGFGGSVAGDLGVGQSLGIGADAGEAIGGAIGGLAGNAITGGKNPLTGLVGGAAAGFGAPSGGTPGPNMPALASAGSSAATSSTLSSGLGNITGGGGSPDLTALPGTFDSTVGGGASPIPGLSTAPATAAAAPAAGSASSGGVSGILNTLGKNAVNSVTKNPLESINSVLGIIQQNQAQGALNKEVKQAENLITSNNAQASGLESALFTGQLPPGAQAAVKQATQAAKAAVRSKYASLGLTGSSMEAQDIANVDQQASSQIFSLASDLYKTGISQSGLSAQLYDAILQAQGGLANESRNALTNYAAAIGGGPYSNKTAA